MLTIGDGSLIRFAVVGLSNTLYGLAVIYAAKYVGGLDDIPANVLGYATGTLLSFTLNKRWTFRYRGPDRGAFVRFVLVTTTAYLLNLLTVLGALRLGINAYVAQAIGVVPYATFGYLASRHFAFRTPQE
jgi:putative flippase GtrA